jgi:hypothetical protein
MKQAYDPDLGTRRLWVRKNSPVDIGSIFSSYDDYTDSNEDVIGFENCNGDDQKSAVAFIKSDYSTRRSNSNTPCALHVVSSFLPSCASVNQKSQAILSAFFSSYIYCMNCSSNVTKSLNGECLTFIKNATFLDPDLAIYAELWVNHNDASAYLVFRGTEIGEIYNIAVDFAANVLVNCNIGDNICGDIGAGFRRAYLSLQSNILSVLKELPSTYNLLVTGHSLGGALATLAAYDVIFKNAFLSVNLITFGSPRVGDSIFRDSFKKLSSLTRFDSWRFVNTNLNNGLDIFLI